MELDTALGMPSMIDLIVGTMMDWKREGLSVAFPVAAALRSPLPHITTMLYALRSSL